MPLQTRLFGLATHVAGLLAIFQATTYRLASHHGVIAFGPIASDRHEKQLHISPPVSAISLNQSHDTKDYPHARHPLPLGTNEVKLKI